MTNDEAKFFADYTREEIGKILKDEGEKSFRVSQLEGNYFGQFKINYNQMTDLSKSLREKLSKILPLTPLILEKTQYDKKTRTSKFLFKLYDGNFIETVLMRTRYRNTVCISTQIGCPIGCKFCASGKHGLVRNLLASEIFAQVHYAKHILLEMEEANLTNIVIMGIGEPFTNFDETLKALQLISHETWGLNISPRRITLSTVGIVPKIEKLAEAEKHIKLAISLHAADDLTRKKIIPGVRYKIQEIINAAHNYFLQTKKIVTIEYLLILNFNSSQSDAVKLAKLLLPFNFKINLIPYNEVPGLPYRRPSKEIVIKFQNVLLNKNLNTHIRDSLGREIDAACGQLRIAAIDENKD
ncbi:MAG: 23S rRNA (adenine(2503)-C(2))-methyltransferase RlmN [Planctomycetes bacterium]|nr:23S rRNA (adenine(2503)-C(2))-methyltransferase RlmN [Planctomycetota bacterium]